MPDFDPDPEDVATGAALGAAGANKRRRRNEDDDDHDGYDDDEGRPSSAGALWLTGLVVIGGCVVMLALILTFAS